MSTDPIRPGVAVMHAGSRTGRRLAHALLRLGVPVRALGRAAGRLADLQAAGAEVRVADARDSRQLAQAFAGVGAVYALMPYDLTQPGYLAQQRALGESMAAALRSAQVPRVVLLSSLGAELSGGTGMIVSLHEQEQRLADIPWLHARFLRAGDFMENRLPALHALAAQGSWCDVLSPQRPVPMVATADIADQALHLLQAPGWRGLAAHEVLGPCDISPAEVTQRLAAHLGLPADEAVPRYTTCSPAELCAVLQAAGLPDDVAALTVQISEAIESGHIRSRAGRQPENGTPTSFSAFLRGLAPPAADR